MIRKASLVVVSALIIFLSFFQHSFALYSWMGKEGNDSMLCAPGLTLERPFHTMGVRAYISSRLFVIR